MRVMSPERMRDVLRSKSWLLPALRVAASVGAASGWLPLTARVGLSSTLFLCPGPPSGALDREDHDDLGRRAPFVGLFPLRLWRRWRMGRNHR
jgi:hypothetical protein